MAVVPGTSYVLAPAPPFTEHRHFISSLLCQNPLRSSNLVLQLQRVDPGTSRAYPLYDITTKRAGIFTKTNADQNRNGATMASVERREVVLQSSDTGAKVAMFKFHNHSGGKGRKRALSREEGQNDNQVSTITLASIDILGRVWTVHPYESKSKSAITTGYEFKTTRPGKNNDTEEDGCVVRWTRRIPIVDPVPSPFRWTTTSPRRSSSSSRTKVASERRHSYPAPTSPRSFASSQHSQKWKMRLCYNTPSSAKGHRTIASLNSHSIHIHSFNSIPMFSRDLSPNGVESEGPCNFNLRSLPPGRLADIAIISAMWVATQEDFASVLRHQVALAGRRTGERIVGSEDEEEEDSAEEKILSKLTRRKARGKSAPAAVSVSSLQTPVDRDRAHLRGIITPLWTTQSGVSNSTKIDQKNRISSLGGDILGHETKVVDTDVSSTNYARRSWEFLSGAGHMIAGKLVSLTV